MRVISKNLVVSIRLEREQERLRMPSTTRSSESPKADRLNGLNSADSRVSKVRSRPTNSKLFEDRKSIGSHQDCSGDSHKSAVHLRRRVPGMAWASSSAIVMSNNVGSPP